MIKENIIDLENRVQTDSQKKEYKEYKRKYYLQNKERMKESNREYYLKNKDKMKEFGRNYRIQKKEKKKELNQNYYFEKKDKIKTSLQEYYIENKDKLKEYNHEYYLENKEKRKESNKEYRNKNKDKIKQLTIQKNIERNNGIYSPLYSWKSEDSVREYFERISPLLHINDLSDWYRISRPQINDMKGIYSHIFYNSIDKLIILRLIQILFH